MVPWRLLAAEVSDPCKDSRHGDTRGGDCAECGCRIWCGKENLSLPHLVRRIPDPDRTLRDMVKKPVSRLQNFTRPRRNERVVHSSLRNQPLEPINRQDIEDTLNTIAEILNAVRCHYVGIPAHPYMVGPRGGAKALLDCLEKAAVVKGVQRARRHRQGGICPVCGTERSGRSKQPTDQPQCR